jgi:hypothetical protein
MKKFDPIGQGLVAPAASLSPVPVHGVAWKQKWRNWWAGTNIASPTTEMFAPAKNSIASVLRFVGAGDVDALNDYYEQETDYARYWTRKVLALSDDVPVILDASGRSSVTLATRMLFHVGRHPDFRGIAGGLPGYLRKVFLVRVTEDGGDAVEAKNASFAPVTKVFFESGSTLAYPAGKEVEEKSINLSSLDNDQFVGALEEAVVQSSSGAGTCGCIVLPTVSETGRLLPVKEVAALVRDLRKRGHNLFFVVDDEQGMARRDAEATADPLSYCDAYLFSASKALGGLLTASAFAMSEELVQIFIEKTQEADFPQEAALAHFQFEPRFEERLPEWILKRGAVSLPEIAAMNAAFMYFYQRGKGDSFAERRRNQLALVEAERTKIVKALSSIAGVRVLESTASRPLVPSIVCFAIEQDGVTAAAVKHALQEGDTVVTPTAVGPYLRLDIPEYRSVPPVNVLAAKLARVLGSLAQQ